MSKITIEIKDKQDADSCTVTIKPQKDLKNVTDTEKQTMIVIYNIICNALKNINK